MFQNQFKLTMYWCPNKFWLKLIRLPMGLKDKNKTSYKTDLIYISIKATHISEIKNNLTEVKKVL